MSSSSRSASTACSSLLLVTSVSISEGGMLLAAYSMITDLARALRRTSRIPGGSELCEFKSSLARGSLAMERLNLILILPGTWCLMERYFLRLTSVLKSMQGSG